MSSLVLEEIKKEDEEEVETFDLNSSDTSISSVDSLDTTLSSVTDTDFCIMSNFTNTLLNILSNNEDNKRYTPDILATTFNNFVNNHIHCLDNIEILNIDKKIIVNICRDIKVQHPHLWTKDIAKLFGALLKTISKAKLHALKAPEEPVEGSYVEAFWANKSWCCGQIQKVHYYNSDGTAAGTAGGTTLTSSVSTNNNNNNNNNNTLNNSKRNSTTGKIVKYDISYLDSSTEKDISRDRIRLLDNKAKYLAEAVKTENYSLLFQYMAEFQNDANTERIGCGLMALIVYSPEWRQNIGDSHKLPLLQMGAGKTLARVIQRNSVVPYTNEDIKEATDEIKNSVAAIDKALRAMYNFTFHQVDSVQDTLVRTLLTDGANEVLYDALQAFPHVHDVQRWGRLTLQRLHNNSRYHSDSDRDGSCSSEDIES